MEIDGRATTDYRRTELAGKIGYVFQKPDHQLFNRSVRAEIIFGPRNLGLDGKEVEARFREAAEIAGVDEQYFDQHPFFLSKGLRQRVAIASVLSMQPETIIVDEPTTGQDYPQSIVVMDFLRKLNETRDHTIIIITHDIYIVVRYARRVLLFKDGAKLADGPTEQVFNDRETLQEARVKAPQITRFSRQVFNRDFLTVDQATTHEEES